MTRAVEGQARRRRRTRSEREICAVARAAQTAMYQSRFMPCPDCGASLDQDERDDHICERERWLDYQIFQLRDEIAGLNGELAVYLASLPGKFEVWYAERERKRADAGGRRTDNPPLHGQS
jgi:hypothetical protein